LKVEKVEPDEVFDPEEKNKPFEPIHRIALELEVKGAEPPEIITPEKAVEIVPDDPEPQLAATAHWYDFLKKLF
jgi:hypothetical protein